MSKLIIKKFIIPIFPNVPYSIGKEDVKGYELIKGFILEKDPSVKKEGGSKVIDIKTSLV